MLGNLPPWLQITPSDYLRATQAGVQAGHAIADSTQRAWEEQERMKMAADQHAAQLSQQAIENAAQRLAADRLEQYRQQEVEARKQQLGIENRRLGSLDIQQQRADDLARHYQAMEAEKVAAASRGATPVTHPEFPGVGFLRQPSGQEIPIVRPPREQSPLERARLQMSGINAMAPRGGEDPTSPDYQSRTNAIGGILRSLSPASVSPAPYKEGALIRNKKDGRVYRVVNGVPVPQSGQDEQDDAD